MKLGILVPAHNEEENIADIITNIEKRLEFSFEIIVINDHSTDKTSDIVSGLSKKYGNLTLVDNRLASGFANAMKTGFSNINTDIVIPVMADQCDDLAAIKTMLDKIGEGYDVVIGSRYIKGGASTGGPAFKSFLSRLAGISLHYLSGIPTTDITNSFKMYRKQVIDGINIKSSNFEISMEIALKAYYSGFKITEIPTAWHERTRGKSNFNLIRLLPAYIKLYTWAILKRLGL